MVFGTFFSFVAYSINWYPVMLPKMLKLLINVQCSTYTNGMLPEAYKQPTGCPREAKCIDKSLFRHTSKVRK